MSDVRNIALFSCFVYMIMRSKVLVLENLSREIPGIVNKIEHNVFVLQVQ